MVRAHLEEAAIVLAVLADEDRVHRRLHVVVDAALAGAPEEREGAVVGVEHHLLPHTMRAALTGLRKRGYAVGIDRADKARGSVYRIEPTEMGGDSAAPHVEAAPTCETPRDRPERAASRPTRRAA